jgi:hypothetical protein
VSNEIIPFGKHKGQSVVEVMATDPQYLDWLAAQDWFAQKYRPIYNIVVNANPPTDTTPEHNALQVKFLQWEFCSAVAAIVLGAEGKPAYLKEMRDMIRWRTESHRSAIKKLLEEARWKRNSWRSNVRNAEKEKHKDAPDKCWVNWAKSVHAELKQKQRELLPLRKAKQQLAIAVQDVERGDCFIRSGNREMEQFADVRFDSAIRLKRFAEAGDGFRVVHTFLVEVKPSVGDDYPAVLRQINGQRQRARMRHVLDVNGHCVLAYERFTGAGVSEIQMRQIFKEARIEPVTFAEIQTVMDRNGIDGLPVAAQSNV